MRTLRPSASPCAKRAARTTRVSRAQLHRRVQLLMRVPAHAEKLAETGLKSVFEQAEAALPPKPVKPKPKPKPRATHSRKRKSRDDDDSDEEEVMPRPTRRSVRAVINTRTDEELKQAIAVRSHGCLCLSAG